MLILSEFDPKRKAISASVPLSLVPGYRYSIKTLVLNLNNKMERR